MILDDVIAETQCTGQNINMTGFVTPTLDWVVCNNDGESSSTLAVAPQGSFVLFMFYIISGRTSSNEDRFFLGLEPNDDDI